MSHTFPVFIGMDERETVAYHVLSHSLHKHSPVPLSITPISRQTLNPVFLRQRNPSESTDFSFARFLVPYLCDYRGWALWMDCDMLVRHDLSDLLRLCNPSNAWRKAVYVVKHDYVPKSATKFLGQINEPYRRKNWSSLMLFNCDRCQELTPTKVNTASGSWLHQFDWLRDECWIGSLDRRWNHLVGEYEPTTDARIYHWTLGGPWFNEYAYAEGAREWFAARDDMLHAEQRVMMEAAD